MVSEVTSITLNQKDEGKKSTRKSDDEHFIHNLVQDRAFMAGHCIRQGKDCRYAVKKVQESSRKDPQVFVNAVVDLAVEARFLSVIRHPVRPSELLFWILLLTTHSSLVHYRTSSK